MSALLVILVALSLATVLLGCAALEDRSPVTTTTTVVSFLPTVPLTVSTFPPPTTTTTVRPTVTFVPTLVPPSG